MRLAAVSTAALVALVATPTAGAKGPLTILVCGPNGCLGTRNRAARADFHRVLYPNRIDERSGPAPVGPYYEIRGDRYYHMTYGYFVRGWSSLSVYYPNSQPEWRRARPELTRELERLAARLRPFPRPLPYRLDLGDRRVQSPANFLRLLGPLPKAASPGYWRRLEWIAFSWEQPNPWSGAYGMSYDRRAGRLFRYGKWLAIPLALARRLHSATS